MLPLSPMFAAAPRQGGLILGSSGLSEPEADRGTRGLAALFGPGGPRPDADG